MRRVPLAVGFASSLAVLSFLAMPAYGQDLLHDNGPLVNSPGTGAGGADESVLQNNSLGFNTLGFGHQLAAGNRVADDFTVPDGQVWKVEEIDFYAYQTNSPTTSTFTAVNLRVWDGTPADIMSNVIFGDTSTNRLLNTQFSNIYRVTETTTGNTQRPIMLNTVGLTGGLVLPPGSYWLDWQSDGTSASGPWAPPITINGLATTGNGRQSIGDNGVSYNSAVDGGTATAQGFPFKLFGQSFTTNGQCISELVAQNCAGLKGQDRAQCVHEQQGTCHAAFDIPSRHADDAETE